MRAVQAVPDTQLSCSCPAAVLELSCICPAAVSHAESINLLHLNDTWGVLGMMPRRM